MTDSKQKYNISISDGSILTGHGGGDYEIMKSFMQAVWLRDQSKILSGHCESLETHLAVFAAEYARENSCVVEM